jgi:hypothetical protein
VPVRFLSLPCCRVFVLVASLLIICRRVQLVSTFMSTSAPQNEAQLDKHFFT